MNFAKIRALASIITARSEIAAAAGMSFGGSRNLNQVLGYKEDISIEDYRNRFRRNSVAARVMETFPKATWRGGGELIEDDTTPKMTPFEQAFEDLAKRLKLWRVFCRADIISGFGQYGTILLGAPGDMGSELPQMKGPDELFYVKPYAEDGLEINDYVTNSKDPRYGQALNYKLKKRVKGQIVVLDKVVHWSRVIHMCDDLDDEVCTYPRLERIWNDLDNLEKVAGGGSEAFWLRANQGYNIDIDPEIDMDEGEEDKLDDEVASYMHSMNRVLRTRGGKVKVLGSDVADFSQPVQSILSLISAGTGIPVRILAGSERGEQASTQDRDNFFDQVADRREQFAEPNTIRQFTDRGIKYGFLPKPDTYEARWSQLKSMDDGQRADLGIKIATVNKFQGSTVITDDELRDIVFKLPPLTKEQKKAIAEAIKAKNPIKPSDAPGQAQPPGEKINPGAPE